MKHSEYQDLVFMYYTENQLKPVDNLDHLYNELAEGEIVAFKRVAPRDLKLHRAYFKFLNYIYGYLPKSFHNQVENKYFYKWLQFLKGDYKIIFKFKDGREQIEYNSISFGRMDEAKFKIYIKEQIPFIYSDVIMQLYDEETSNNIIETIEQDFEKFMTKLFAVKTNII